MDKRSTTSTQNCHHSNSVRCQTKNSDGHWISGQKLVCFLLWYLVHLSFSANVRTWDFCVYYMRDVDISLRRSETEKAFLLRANGLTSKTTLCSSVESKAAWGELLRKVKESRLNPSFCSCKTWLNILATGIAHCRSGDRRNGGRFSHKSTNFDNS